MKNNLKCFFAGMLIFSASVVHIAKAEETKPQVQVLSQGNVMLGQYLVAAGEKLNCFFTIELNDSTISSQTVMINDLETTSIESLPFNLQRQFPTLNVTKNVDRSNRLVFHIVEKSLRDMPKYAIDQKIQLSYEGLLWTLPNQIGKSLHDSMSIEGPKVSGPVFDPPATQVQINVKDSSVRDILTDNMKIAYPILWSSYIKNSDDDMKVIVRYPGSGSF